MCLMSRSDPLSLRPRRVGEGKMCTILTLGPFRLDGSWCLDHLSSDPTLSPQVPEQVVARRGMGAGVVKGPFSG